MSNEKQQEAPTIAPKFNVEAYGRASLERRLAQAEHRVAREVIEAYVETAIPKASPPRACRRRSLHSPLQRPGRRGLGAASPIWLTFPTESFLFGFIDGARTGGGNPGASEPAAA